MKTGEKFPKYNGSNLYSYTLSSSCLASTLSHGDLRSISQAKDSNQSFLWRARSSSTAGHPLGQMAHGQVDGKRKLFEEICFLISDLSCPCFFASAFCFCLFFCIYSSWKWETFEIGKLLKPRRAIGWNEKRLENPKSHQGYKLKVGNSRIYSYQCYHFKGLMPK